MRFHFDHLHIFVYLVLLTGADLIAATFSPSLRGKIEDINGNALPGIRVSISTATPKTGPAYLCPSCYIDCGKATDTDSNGEFEIPDLDPNLIFELLAVGDGFIAQFVPRIDPADWPISILLTPLEMTHVSLNQIVTGSIADTEGEAIQHAVVTVIGHATGTRDRYGRPRDIMETPVAVTAENGQFVLVANQPVKALHLRVTARNYANQEFYDVPPGKPDQSFTLPRGATVTGRLIHDGKPLPERKIEIASTQRSPRSNFTQSSTKTNEKGEFTFFNLPPKLVYFVTASAKSVESLGMTPLRRLGPFRNEEERRIEDLTISKGLTISGNVRTRNGTPVPPDSVLVFSHDRIWNPRSILLPPDGHFNLSGLHPGKIRITVKAPGYRIASRNRSFSSLNNGELLATLNQSRENLIFLIEPGEWSQWPLRRPNFTGSEVVSKRPLRGIEALSRSDQAASVIVHAYDSVTKKRLSDIQVTPGWLFEGGSTPIWQRYQTQAWHGDQPFTIAKRSGSAHILVHAEGYIPKSFEVNGRFDSEIKCYLKKGSGYGGTILTPTGEPAIGAEILQTKTWPNNDRPYLVFIKEGAFRPDSLKQHVSQETDIEGRFQLPATDKPFPLIITHATGYLAIQNPQSQGPVELRLNAWSTVKGTIKSPADRELDLGIHRLPSIPMNKPAPSFFQKVLRRIGLDDRREKPSFWSFVHVQPTIERNDSGSFVLSHVPPGRWSVNLLRYEPYGNQHGSHIGRHIRQAPLSVLPGKTGTILFP